MYVVHLEPPACGPCWSLETPLHRLRRSVVWFPFYVRKTELDVVSLKVLFFIRVCKQVYSTLVLSVSEVWSLFTGKKITRELAPHAASRGMMCNLGLWALLNHLHHLVSLQTHTQRPHINPKLLFWQQMARRCRNFTFFLFHALSAHMIQQDAIKHHPT